MSDKVKLANTFQVDGLSKYLTGIVIQLKQPKNQKAIAFTDKQAQYFI